MLKQLNVKLKQLGSNKGVTFFISVLCVMSISLLVGIGDYDVIWQTYLGKVIVTEHRFDGLQDLVWGNQWLGWYLDHEWLTNVIFYLLSIVFGQMGGIIAYKIIIIILTSICAYYLLKEFTDFTNMSWFTYLACICMSYIYAMLLIKPKAYDLSTVFVLCTFIVLEKYRKHTILFIKFAVYICLITLFWNNIHSGSVLLIYGIVGAYWLFHFRDIKIIILGIFDLFVLCVNPFGYKLLYFDVTHFSDSVMKKIVTEWDGFNINTFWAKAVVLLIAIMFIHLLHMTRDKENWIYFLFFFVFTLMTIISKRHCLYLYPIGLIIFVKGQFTDLKQWKIKTFMIPTLLLFMLAISIEMLMWMTVPAEDMKKSYMKEQITPELQTIIIKTTTDDNYGFYDGDQNVWDFGVKSFRIGAFPFTRERNIASYYLEFESDTQIEKVIDKYGLNKFLFFKYKASVEGAAITTHLYDYLIAHNYDLLYDDEHLVYFVEKKGE